MVPALAEAANRRIAISDYSWSDPEIEIDLGERVTWYWTGPDTLHSVTGESDNAKGIDSDPGSLPRHNVGDDFQLTFDQPGAYEFQCKLHSLVRGTVTVSNSPGDPVTEPDPIPPNRVDLKKPLLRDARVAPVFGAKGATLQHSVNELGKLDVEYYRREQGELKFAGWAVYKSFIGYNRARIGVRKPNFKPKPGRYTIELRATDESRNTSRVQRLGFRIR